MVEKLTSNIAPRVLANSIPKSGTNLLMRSLYLIPILGRKFVKTISYSDAEKVKEKLLKVRPGEIVPAHVKYDKSLSVYLKQAKIKHILIVRDPRDIAVSNYVYTTHKDRNHRLHRYFLNELKKDKERLMASICGIAGSKLQDGLESMSLAAHINDYLLWKNDPDCLFVSFENIIGSKGGGDDVAQLDTLKLGVNIGNRKLAEIGSKLFTKGSRTFVKGQIG